VANPLWTSDEIQEVTAGRLEGKPFKATGVSIDTRSLERGDLFVALAGARDGHEFVASALELGAAGALVARPGPGPSIIVDDALAALAQLGVAARDRSAALRCAVTGSVGKTSVTQAIAAGLKLAGRYHSSIKSYNNHIGVPLTLVRMPADTQRAVFEVGMNHAGEITPLSHMIAPDVVVITTVGPVHTENFPDGEAGVARAKTEIFAGLKKGGLAILPADNRWFGQLKAAADKAGARVLTFGARDGADARLLTFNPRGVVAMIHGRRVKFTLRQTADHWGLSSLAVLLALEVLKVPRIRAIRAMSEFEPLEGRGAERQIDGFTLIDESYNANPLSMASAIRTLGARPVSGRRIVVLTDMLELGEDGPAFHGALAGEIDAAAVDLVFCAGPLMKWLWDVLPSTQQGGYAGTAAELAPLVAKAVRPGDVVMVKGSNGSRAHLVARALSQVQSDNGGRA